jgi:hypothetical protein
MKENTSPQKPQSEQKKEQVRRPAISARILRLLSAVPKTKITTAS